MAYVSCPQVKMPARAHLLASVAVVGAISIPFPAFAQPSAAGSELPAISVKQNAPKPAAKKKAPQSVPEADTPAPQGPPVTATTPATSLKAADDGISRPLSATTLTTEHITAQRVVTSNTAELLRSAPGVSMYQGGGVSGMPAINGLNGDRVKILVNGMVVTSACANHMNPPLSYIDPAQVARAEVISGVTPVSKGGDSIAGTVIVETAPPHFTHGGEVHTAGSVGTFYRSNGDGAGVNATAHAASANVTADYAGAWVRSNNYEDGRGAEIASTEYESQNHSLQLAFKDGSDVYSVQGGFQKIPYQGFVNQRMDMVDNESWFLNARALNQVSWGNIETKVFYQHIDHEMNFLDDKKFNTVPPRNMPMITEGVDAGYAIKFEIPVSTQDLVRVGNELHHNTLDDYWPATMAMVGMMGPNTYVTINDGTRTRLGTFIEWERKWDTALSTLLGIRNDMVWMDTGNVQGYNNSPMSVYAADAAAFNARDHQRTDANFDATALARYEPDDTSTFEFGYAMKSRSPNFYERYAWSSSVGDMGMAIPQMAMNMIGWFGDGNGYTGNLDLDPERAHTVSVTSGWHSPDKAWALKVTPYYTYVEDYIGVRKIQDSFGAAHVGFVNLQFVNHDAELYGVNIAGAIPLGSSDTLGTFALTAVASYVQGENVETGVSLYHMMPFNTQIAIAHRLGGWSSAIEFDLVAGKTNVDTVRNELETAGYALVNFRTGYETAGWRFDFGVQNVFNTYFEHPLGGINIEPTMGNRLPSLGGREDKDNVPGQGRSFNVGATYRF
jgi:iron complex outermembrane receptor protein